MPTDSSITTALETLSGELDRAPLSALPEAIGALEGLKSRALWRFVQPARDAAEDPLLTMDEVAKRLSINVSQARELGRRGELPQVTIGRRHVRVRASVLAEWIRRREVGAK